MAQSQNLDVELMPMNSRTYPEETETLESEETKSPTIQPPPSASIMPQRPVSVNLNPTNQTSSLQNQHPPRPASMNLNPTYNRPVINQAPRPSFSGRQNTIKCSTCYLLMSYPVEAYFVTCPNCRNITATKCLIPMLCTYCRVKSYFPQEAPSVRCQCGVVYANPYVRG